MPLTGLWNPAGMRCCRATHVINSWVHCHTQTCVHRCACVLVYDCPKVWQTWKWKHRSLKCWLSQQDHRRWKRVERTLFWKALVEVSPGSSNQFKWRGAAAAQEGWGGSRGQRHLIDCGDLQWEQPIRKNQRKTMASRRELKCNKCVIKHNITLANDTEQHVVLENTLARVSPILF